MSKKIFSDQTLSELKITEKKQRTLVLIHVTALAIATAVTTYFIVDNGFSFTSLIPILFLPLPLFSMLNLKKVRDEIKVREKHIFLQNKNL